MAFRWLTPNLEDLESPEICVQLSIPQGLFNYLAGAIAELNIEYNWDDFGTATPKQTTDVMLEYLSEFGSEPCGGGMNWINGIPLELDREVGHDGIKGLILNDSNLPSQVLGSTALVLTIDVQFSADNQSIWYYYGSLFARQVFTNPIANQSRNYTVFAPFVANETRILTRNSSPITFDWVVNLVGWV